MKLSPTPPLPTIYQLRIVLRGVSPLVWRRLLVPCHTSLAHLHDILQIAFAWSGEHLYDFHIHGKDYGSHGADASHMPLRDVRWQCGERFRYIYNYFADWACDIRLEAILPCDPTRVYPICIGGQRAAPPEECAGTWGYMERLDQHRSPPIDAMLVVADAIKVMLEVDPHISVREALGELDDLRDAVDRLEAYQAFQPDHFDRGDINRQLLVWGQKEGAGRCR
jgi:hypothetical protein